MRCLIVCPELLSKQASSQSIRYHAEEFLRLAKALPGLEVKSEICVKLKSFNAGLYFGKGKVFQLKNLINSNDIQLTLVNSALSPIQQRNLERHLNTKVLDRTGLILEIFGARAKTKEGTLQVELAHLEYQKTRLVRSWTHLERQRGGTGFLGGPGETQIESDKRILSYKISKIKNLLKRVIKTRSLHRERRKKNNFPVIAIVGYTNAGKSTLFNYMTGAKVMVRDMLFATLDPTMRFIDFNDHTRAILSDTVGFIENLPTSLISAFRATLEEVTSASLILHVIDISSVQSKSQAQSVRKIILDLPWEGKRIPQIIDVYNKIDKLDPGYLKKLKISYANSRNKILVSAKTGYGYDYLENIIINFLAERKTSEDIFLTFSQKRERFWLFKNKIILSEQIQNDGYLLKVRWTDCEKEKFLAI